MAAGFGVGVLTGFCGVGGGFIIVPVLVLLLGLPVRIAVGTSLLIIAVTALAGLAGHLGPASPGRSRRLLRRRRARRRVARRPHRRTACPPCA